VQKNGKKYAQIEHGVEGFISDIRYFDPNGQMSKRYIMDDRGFVRVGMSLALAFFLAPIPTALFAAVLALGIIGFNLGKGHFVHGLYQFFASALGFSLLFYPLGYYTVWTGSFGDAISHDILTDYKLMVLAVDETGARFV